MFTYLIEIQDKETNDILDSKEFTENIYFKQVFSGDTYEEQQHNISQCLFIYQSEEDPSVIKDMCIYLQNNRQKIVNIIISVKNHKGKTHLIKKYSSISNINLSLTTFNNENNPLGYILTVTEG